MNKNIKLLIFSFILFFGFCHAKLNEEKKKDKPEVKKTVKLIVYSDYTCVACQTLREFIIPQLKVKYSYLEIDERQVYATKTDANRWAVVLTEIAKEYGKEEDVKNRLYRQSYICNLSARQI